MDEELFLIYIKYIGQNHDENYMYEFYFSTYIDDVWGDNFEHKPAGICRELEPYNDNISEIKRITLKFQLDLAQEQTCFSMQDVIDGCCALAWENIDGKEYPEEGRVVLQFGETFDDVENILSRKGSFFL